MSLQSDSCLRHVGCPERNATILVTQVQNGGMCVLCEGRAGSESRLMGRDELARGCVLVFEMPCVADASEKPVIGEELEPCGFDVILELVHLDAVLVVDVDILLLSNREERLVVKIPSDKSPLC